MLRGQWKILPNFRTDANGKVQYYCPPEQVEGQVAELLAYLGEHDNDHTSVCVLAAWFHHRFTYIHPFQDGNGRIARALVNYLFIKAGLFPVVVDREQKVEYLDALASADTGNLSHLVQLFTAKQIEAIKQALSLTRAGNIEVTPTPLIKDLAHAIVRRERQRKDQEQTEFRKVNVITTKLSEFATIQVRSKLQEFQQELNAAGLGVTSNLDTGGTFDNRGHYYRQQIIRTAYQAQHWANFNEDSRWIRALVQGKTGQLRFILSFHHVGHDLTGVAEVTSFADLEDLETDTRTVDIETLRTLDSVRSPVDCMIQPFTVTWRDEPDDLYTRFEEWFTNSLAVSLRAWAETL